MDAHVYLGEDGYHYISYRIAGTGSEVDSAGPFDDETEAVLSAERNIYGAGVVVVTSIVTVAA